MNLRPSEIRFSQHDISRRFGWYSDHGHMAIGETLDSLCEGRCSIHDIPTIGVMMRDGHWTTADNRRLWVFRHLERLGKCATIPVREVNYINPNKLNSRNGGVDIEIRYDCDPGGIWHSKPSVYRETRLQDEGTPARPGTRTSAPNPSVSENMYRDFESMSIHKRPSVSSFNRYESSTSFGNHLETDRTGTNTFSDSRRNDTLFVCPPYWEPTSVNHRPGTADTVYPRGLAARRESSGLTLMDPWHLKYTNTNLPATFEDGRPLSRLKCDISFGLISSTSVSPLKVFKVFGYYYVMDGNRRLKVFRDVGNRSASKVRVNVTDLDGNEDDFIDSIRERYPHLQLFDVLKMGETVTITG